MSLWKPGQVEGVTFRNAKLQLGIDGVSLMQLREILKKIGQEHAMPPEAGKWDRDFWADLKWDEMPIREWNTNVSADDAFDLICAACDTGFTFPHPGMLRREVTIVSAAGGMQLVDPEFDEHRGVVVDTVYRAGEKPVANMLKLAGFENPDPYLGLIEVEYCSKGCRAGYGIRKSGKAECWYD